MSALGLVLSRRQQACSRDHNKCLFEGFALQGRALPKPCGFKAVICAAYTPFMINELGNGVEQAEHRPF